MRRRGRRLWGTAVVSVAVWAATAATLSRGRLRILAYHDVSDASRFAAQLDLLADGYRTVTGPVVANWLEGRGSLPDRPVWITFDDGDPTVLDVAAPMLAERDTTDRYLAAYLVDRVGSEFPGAIAGVARFGLFVKLDETGADGLVPISSLGREYFAWDPDTQTLTGETSRRVLGLGQRVLVRLAEAAPITGGLLFELLEVEGRRLPTPPRRAAKGAPRRKLAKSRTMERRRGGR